MTESSAVLLPDSSVSVPSMDNDVRFRILVFVLGMTPVALLIAGMVMSYPK